MNKVGDEFGGGQAGGVPAGGVMDEDILAYLDRCDGRGCECGAYGRSECGCEVLWPDDGIGPAMQAIIALRQQLAAAEERERMLREAASYCLRSLGHYAPSIEKMKKRLSESLAAEGDDPRSKGTSATASRDLKMTDP